MRLAIALVLVPAALAAAAGQALSNRGGETLAGSRAFSIDGRRFFLELPSGNCTSLVERELKRRGIDTVPISESLRTVVGTGAIELLREEPEETATPRLPTGLEPDHVLRLQTVSGPVEITFGRVDCAEKDLLRRLRSAGWECRDVDAHGAPSAIAQLTGRKEATLVLLERVEGRFLSIRRPVR